MFLHCLFLLKRGPEMMFGDVLDKKEPLLDNKNMYLICPKKKKNFPKGLTHDFCQKNSNFLYCLFLLQIGPEMMFGDVLDRKRSLTRQ